MNIYFDIEAISKSLNNKSNIFTKKNRLFCSFICDLSIFFNLHPLFLFQIWIFLLKMEYLIYFIYQVASFIFWFVSSIFFRLEELFINYWIVLFHCNTQKVSTIINVSTVANFCFRTWKKKRSKVVTVHLYNWDSFNTHRIWRISNSILRQ